jgi:hypothetical protein
VPDPPLDIGDDLTALDLVPATIELLRHHPELDDEVAGQVLRLDLTALFPPQPKQGSLVLAHDDAGVGTADEGSPVSRCSHSWHRSISIVSLITYIIYYRSFMFQPFSTELMKLNKLGTLPGWSHRNSAGLRAVYWIGAKRSWRPRLQ